MKVSRDKKWTIDLSQSEAEALRYVLNHYLRSIHEDEYDLAMNGFIASIMDELPEALRNLGL